VRKIRRLQPHRERAAAAAWLALAVGCGNPSPQLAKDAVTQADTAAQAETSGPQAETSDVNNDAAQADEGQADSPIPDTAQGDAPQFDAAQSETAQPDTAGVDAAEGDAVAGDVAAAEVAQDTADAAAPDTVACTGPTCVGAPFPTWQLVDFQPKSPGFQKSYGLSTFLGKVTVVGLYAAT